jgi:hypothetical protein
LSSVATSSTTGWLAKAQTLMKKFAEDHRIVLGTTERQLSASFEIACLHALLHFYKKQGC